MHSPSNEQLDFWHALFRPLVTTAEAAVLCGGCTDRHVLDLLDEGLLRGVNIALSADTRRDLRIYRYSAHHYLIDNESPLPQIDVATTLPHSRPTILRHELADWLSCSGQHISNLGKERVITGPGRANGREARNLFHRASVIDWLTTREIGANT
jgi:hypothetical protein